MAAPNEPRDFAPSDFFAFRTPLLPFEELLGWSEGLQAAAGASDPAQFEAAFQADRSLLRERLRVLVGCPEVRDALFVASPSLEASIDIWLTQPDGERGRKAELSIVRYLMRMAGRATPFGLFAGCSVGTLGEETHLVVEARDTYRRHTRLDMDYVCALTDALGREPELRKTLRYRPNSSLYRTAGRIRYVETRLADKVRSHHLVAVESTPYLEAVLQRAEPGTLPAELAQMLVENMSDVSREEAEGYIQELIDSQLLVSELPPAVTGPEPIHGVVKHLDGAASTRAAAACLDRTRRALDEIDAQGLGAGPARYRAIADDLGTLPTPVELARLFQVDMVKPAPAATLGRAPLEEIVRGVEILRRLSGGRGRDRLTAFREAFVARYEGRQVPLVEVLDEEAGIGFERSSVASAEASPLLEGLVFPPAPGEPTVPWGPRQALLLRKLGEAVAAGAQEIVLEPNDLTAMETRDPLPLPDAFAVMATLCAESDQTFTEGRFQVVLGTIWGPSGANLLGRFCHADEKLQHLLEQHLRAEEALEPDAVFAEIVHLPEGRVGNILARPVMRGHEVPFLGRSGAAAEQQIPITDLLVSVQGERVDLYSARLRRRIIPRLTSAHNITHPRNLGLYRFLCLLQQQGTAGALGWDWGILQSEPFLPRVVTGKLVLVRARWLMGRKLLKALEEARGATWFSKIQEWRAEVRLPRFVALADGDNLLPVDLDNLLSVETFVHLVKERGQAAVMEMFPPPEQLCARGPEGRFVHELVVPFVRTRPIASRKPPKMDGTLAKPQRSFPPGSEWLYVKLYTGTSTADRLLREVVRPTVTQAMQSGAADRWFFIRYGDPEWHLRLRFHGTPEGLRQAVFPMLQAAVLPWLADGSLWRLQLDTYEREIERYGGLLGTVMAERVFHADSEAALLIVEHLSGDEGADARWRLALGGIDRLLNDLGLDLSAKYELLQRLRQSFGTEFQADTTYFKHQLGDRFRKQRRRVEPLLDGALDLAGLPPAALAALQKRSELLDHILRDLKDAERTGQLSLPMTEIVPSYIHMQVNRLLRSVHRAQELVLYDFLCRLYESRLARTGGKPQRRARERTKREARTVAVSPIPGGRE